jgi:hypothetical protein
MVKFSVLELVNRCRLTEPLSFRHHAVVKGTTRQWVWAVAKLPSPVLNRGSFARSLLTRFKGPRRATESRRREQPPGIQAFLMPAQGCELGSATGIRPARRILSDTSPISSETRRARQEHRCSRPTDPAFGHPLPGGVALPFRSTGDNDLRHAARIPLPLTKGKSEWVLGGPRTIRKTETRITRREPG